MRATAYRLEKEFIEQWTRKCPVPLEMSDTEILDFASEHAGVIRQVDADAVYPRRVFINISGMKPVIGSSLREAVQFAAAVMKEEG